MEQFGGLLFGQAMFVMQVHIEAKPYKPAKESLLQVRISPYWNHDRPGGPDSQEQTPPWRQDERGKPHRPKRALALGPPQMDDHSVL